MKQIIKAEKAPDAIGAYSQGVISNGTIYISGQLPIDAKTGDIPKDVESQVEQSMRNIQAIVEKAGSSLDKVLKCGLFIKNMDDFGKINGIYAKFFDKDFPARFVVEVSRLPKDVLVEIDAIVAI